MCIPYTIWCPYESEWSSNIACWEIFLSIKNTHRYYIYLCARRSSMLDLLTCGWRAGDCRVIDAARAIYSCSGGHVTRLTPTIKSKEKKNEKVAKNHQRHHFQILRTRDRYIYKMNEIKAKASHCSYTYIHMFQIMTMIISTKEKNTIILTVHVKNATVVWHFIESIYFVYFWNKCYRWCLCCHWHCHCQCQCHCQ